MSAAFRSELLKLRTTRTTAGLLLAAMGIVVLTTVVPLVLGDPGRATDLSLYDESTQRSIFLAPAAAVLFAAFAGLLSITGEFRHGTIRPTFVFVPRRELVVAAKLEAALLTGAIIGALAVAATDAIAVPWLEREGVRRWLGTEELVEIGLGVVAACALWAVIGVGVGALVRSQVGAIVTVIAWNIVETILIGVVPRVGRFTPGEAANAVCGSDGNLLSPGAGLAVLVAWAAAFAVAAVTATRVRDVP